MKALGMMMTLALAAVVLVAAHPGLARGPEVGRVKNAQGTALMTVDGSRMPIRAGVAVHLGDGLETGADGVLGVSFKDGTTLSLGHGSYVEIDEFLFDPVAEELSFSTGVLHGTAAFLSGRIAKLAPESFKVKTALGGAGVRGTQFTVAADDVRTLLQDASGHVVRDGSGQPVRLSFPATLFAGPGANMFVLLADPDGTVGKLAVRGEAGEALLVRPREATVLDAGTVPSIPEVIDEETLQAVFGPALRARPQPPRFFSFYFESGSDRMTPDAGVVLAQVVEAARGRAYVDVLIVGHADRVGTNDGNRGLSLRRAEAVRSALVGRGVSADATEVRYHGENDPAVPTADEVAEPRNRRVEVMVR